MGQEEPSLLSALVYLLSILSNAYRQTDFVLQEELGIPLNDQTGFAVKRKTRVSRVYTVMQKHCCCWNLNKSNKGETLKLAASPVTLNLDSMETERPKGVA